MRFQYGDLLRYPPTEDTGGLYRFMFLKSEFTVTLGSLGSGYMNVVMVAQCPFQDDLWNVGSIILTGENELVRATDD